MSGVPIQGAVLRLSPKVFIGAALAGCAVALIPASQSPVLTHCSVWNIVLVTIVRGVLGQLLPPCQRDIAHTVWLFCIGLACVGSIRSAFVQDPVELTIEGQTGYAFKDIPASVKVLTLKGEQNDELSNLPDHLEQLTIEGKTGYAFKDIPASVKVLTLRGDQNDELSNLPDHLEYLRLDGKTSYNLKTLRDTARRTVYLRGKAFQAHFDQLPVWLSRLHLEDNSVESNVSWPSALTELSFCNVTGLTSLSGLPKGVQTLMLANMDSPNLKGMHQSVYLLILENMSGDVDLADIGSSVRDLHLINMGMVSLSQLSDHVDTLTIMRPDPALDLNELKRSVEWLTLIDVDPQAYPDTIGHLKYRKICIRRGGVQVVTYSVHDESDER